MVWFGVFSYCTVPALENVFFVSQSLPLTQCTRPKVPLPQFNLVANSAVERQMALFPYSIPERDIAEL
jgi:hypothetical protein